MVLRREGCSSKLGMQNSVHSNAATSRNVGTLCLPGKKCKYGFIRMQRLQLSRKVCSNYYRRLHDNIYMKKYKKRKQGNDILTNFETISSFNQLYFCYALTFITTTNIILYLVMPNNYEDKRCWMLLCQTQQSRL